MGFNGSSGSRSFRSGSYCDFSDAVVELCLPGVGVSGLVEVVGLVGEGIHVLTEEEKMWLRSSSKTRARSTSIVNENNGFY